MMHHGAPSAKRSRVYSSMRDILDLDRGVLSKAEREKKTKIKTASY